MDLGKVEKVMQLMRSYGMHEIEIKEGDTQIKLTQSPQVPATYGQYALPSFPPASMPAPARHGGAAGWDGPEGHAEAVPHAASGGKGALKGERRANASEIRSPFVGTFYAAPSPGSDDFIHVGKRVRKGDTLCIVEAMKLMNEIEAERDGVIVEILVENEEPVEYDQVLFVLE